MRVIKLGGSLLDSAQLPDCLNAIKMRYRNKAVVIVPGGGVFAEQVRTSQQQWRFDDHTAHAMAILAMQQMALLFHALVPEFVIAHTLAEARKCLTERKTVIWSPDLQELNNAGIAASWDVSSDSLAAWLATRIAAAELVLVKAASIDAKLSLMELSERQIVDQAFPEFAANALFSVTISNASAFQEAQ